MQPNRTTLPRPAAAQPIVVICTILVGGMANAAPPGPGWLSGQQVQNLGSATATITLTVTGPDGASTSCGTRQVPPGASTTYLTERDCPVPPGFRGSGVITSDQPVASIVNVINKPAGTAAGQYRGTGNAEARPTLYFPLIKHNHAGRTTSCYVQNGGDSPATITATFHMPAGATYTSTYSNVPPKASVEIVPQDAGVPKGMGQVGSLVVTATNDLAGAVLEHEHSATIGTNLQASRAFSSTDFDDTVFCPLVRHDHTSKKMSTGVQVQNVGDKTQTVHVSYSNGQHESATIAPSASHTFYNPSFLFPGTLASATITGSGDLLAVVNDKGTATHDPTTVTTYSCFGKHSATNKVSLPLVKEVFHHKTTGVQVQNVGTSPTKVTATYSNSKGVFKLRTATAIAPGASFTFYRVHRGTTAGVTVLQGDPAQLEGTNNGVVLEASQPIVAMANEACAGGDPQDTKNYEGFNR